MKAKRALHAVAFEQRLALPYFFENFSWEILAFQQQTKPRFVERWILKQRQEHIRRRMMQERGKLVAGGDARAFPVVGNGFGGNRLRHELTFRDFERTRQGIAS